jgi:hypothetical protein
MIKQKNASSNKKVSVSLLTSEIDREIEIGEEEYL